MVESSDKCERLFQSPWDPLHRSPSVKPHHALTGPMEILLWCWMIDQEGLAEDTTFPGPRQRAEA